MHQYLIRNFCFITLLLAMSYLPSSCARRESPKCREYVANVVVPAHMNGLDFATQCELAQRGDAVSQLVLFRVLVEDSERVGEAWEWLCRAANQNYAQAQEELADWYSEDKWSKWSTRPSTYYGRGMTWLMSKGIAPDNRISYMWLSLAAANGDGFIRSRRDLTARYLQSEELVQAEQMINNWKPGDCPSAEHRLGMLGQH